jgi:hypothetical protein
MPEHILYEEVVHIIPLQRQKASPRDGYYFNVSVI